MKKDNSVLYIIIGVLLILLISLGLYVLQTGKDENKGDEKDLALQITVIGDKRCTNCATNEIMTQLKSEQYLAKANFVEKDFMDTGVSDYLMNNKIVTLPAFIFSNKEFQDDGKMKQFLVELADKSYSLNVGAKFDPFAKRSARGFLLLDLQILNDIKKDSYIDGNENAQLTWLEYSDLECPYCAKFHNSGTIGEVEAKYGNDINKIFHHFPLEFHKNAFPAAQILECLGKEKGVDAFYSLITTSYKAEDSTEKFLLDEAEKLGANRQDLDKCIQDNVFKTKIEEQMSTGKNVFHVTGTPASIVINNETGEYEVLSGAMPTQFFTDVIDKLK